MKSSFPYPESISIAHGPSRIEYLDRLTRELNGPEIYIKRDDDTSCLLSGNKVRKLEFFLADAFEKGADTLITCGGSSRTMRGQQPLLQKGGGSIAISS